MKIFLYPLHVTHWFIKFLAKAMAKINSKVFQYLSETLPKISAAKLKEGVFVGPQIRESLEDEAFVESLTQNKQPGKAFSGSVQTSWVERSFLISVRLSRNFWMRIRKQEVACHLKFTFCISV